MKRKIQLTESQLIGVIKRIISEQSEHVKNLYTSWVNKKSGNPEQALKLMDDVFKYQKQLPKKDFAQYSSYEELKKDINRIKSEEKSTDATKLYEDSDLLVLAANTWEASCKYGAGSKWCTTAREDSSYWNRHNQTGTEFFWIFKNKPQDDPNHKFSYHIKIDGGTDWCNAVNTCMGDERLPQNSYPKQHPKYYEIVNKLQKFHNSREFKFIPSKTQNHVNIYDFNQSYIKNLLRGEIMNIISRDFIVGVVGGVFNDAVKLFTENDLSDDFFIKTTDTIRDRCNARKNDIIIESLDYVYRNIVNDLAWIINRDLNTNDNFDNGQPFEQQMEEQNITIGDLYDDIINRNPNEVVEIIKEVSGRVIMGKVEDEVEGVYKELFDIS